MEDFKSIKIDNRLNKDEIQEVKELSKDKDKLNTLLETNTNFKDFINSEYRWANENYLAKNGKTVNDLQKALGFSKKDQDGVFGKQTFFAVIKFQKANGLVVDGLVGNKTQAKLLGKKEIVHYKIKEHFLNKEVNNGFSSIFTSKPYEKNKKGIPLCSKTARLNLENFGLTNVKRGDSAINSMVLYGNNKNYVNNFGSLPKKTNVLDLFIDSKSQYEHRAAAYLNNGEWFVLDPYSKIFNNTIKPIPFNNYIASNKIMGVFPHTA